MMEEIKTVKLPKQIAFSSLRAAERRVLIAKDVIKALKAKRMEARKGHYTVMEPYVNFKNTLDLGLEEENDARAAFAKQCTVCAKGSLLIAAIDRFNKVSLGDLGDWHSISIDSPEDEPYKWISKLFPRKDLAAIEIAFEGTIYCGEDSEWLEDHHNDLVTKALNFYHAHSSAESRLEAIMKNIVKNKGRFKP